MLPGRISSIGSPSHCTHPTPKVTNSVWPSGCVCQAMHGPWSNVTVAPPVRVGESAWKGASMRTVPVNQSDGLVSVTRVQQAHRRGLTPAARTGTMRVIPAPCGPLSCKRDSRTRLWCRKDPVRRAGTSSEDWFVGFAAHERVCRNSVRSDFAPIEKAVRGIPRTAFSVLRTEVARVMHR